MGLSTFFQSIFGSAHRKPPVSEQSDRFREIFREACQVIPDTKILVNWMVYSLGVLSVHSTESEINLIEDEIWNHKQMVRH